MAGDGDRTQDGDGSRWLVPPPYVANPDPETAADAVPERAIVANQEPAQAPTPAPIPQPMTRPPVNYRPAEAGWWLATDHLWYPPEALPAQAAPMPAPPPPIGHPVQHPYAPGPITHATISPPKSKLAAGLLALVFGILGIHRFYLGYTGLGMTMLLLSILSLGLLVPVVAIWSIIDAILIFTGSIKDSKGQPLA